MNRTAVAAVATVLALTACTTPDPNPIDQVMPTTAPATPSQTASPEPARTDLWPLTGLPASDPDERNRPAIVAKVSNMRDSQPQAGIDKADIVVVEPNGINYTRLAAVFHTQLPERVGPIRSLREGDSKLFGQLSPVIASYGAAVWVMELIDANPAIDNQAVTKGHRGGTYTRDERRARPDNAFVNLPLLQKQAKAKAAPEPMFQYAASLDQASAVQGEPGTNIVVSYGSDTYTMSYRYDPETSTYPRTQPWGGTPHVSEGGVRIAPTNIVIMRINWTLVDEQGREQTSPVLHITNTSGPFIAATGGKQIKGTWTKAGTNDPFVFTLDDGSPLLLAPGQTFVELPRHDQSVIVGG